MTLILWSRVQHTAERVAIIATGPSLKGVDLVIPDGITVIAVNGALPHVPRADFWFTLDTSPANRALMATAASRPETVFYAAVFPDFGQPEATSNYLRDPPEPCVHYLKRVTGTARANGKEGLSVKPTGVHAGNSAYGALGLAYLMGARRIALLGVDGNQAAGYAWAEGRPKNLQDLPELFASAVPQLEAAGISVVNGSPRSRVNCWPRMTPQEALEWLVGLECGQRETGPIKSRVLPTSSHAGSASPLDFSSR